MAFDYINEAFKKLDLLNEEMFNSSTDGINHLTDYMRDEEASEDTIRVIDPDATDEEELQDSYIGKLIVNCNVCHSHIFMNKEDVELDEEGYATSDDCCPYCGEQEGFVIVGEIAPANVKDDSSEASETEQDTEFEDKEVDESLTEDFKEVSIKTDDQHLAMTSDENGKVTVVTEPLNSSSQEEIDAETVEEGSIAGETIVPVSDETTNEIVDKETIPEDEVESPSEDETSLSDEDAASDTEEESTETEDTAADEDTTDDEMVEESYFSSNRDNNLNELFGFGGKKVKVYVAPKCYNLAKSLDTSTFGDVINTCLFKIVFKELSGKIEKPKSFDEYLFNEKFPEAKKQQFKGGYMFICKEKKLDDIRRLIFSGFKDKMVKSATYADNKSDITPRQMEVIGRLSDYDFVQITTEVVKESLDRSSDSDNNLNELFGFGGNKVKVYVAPKCYTKNLLNSSDTGSEMNWCLGKVLRNEFSGKVDTIKPFEDYLFDEKFPEARKQRFKGGYTFTCKEKKLSDIKQIIFKKFKDKMIEEATNKNSATELTPQQRTLIPKLSSDDLLQLTTEVVKESFTPSQSDVYFESVDEKQLNSITESYLKNVYENVSSFKTTGVGADDSHLVVEGVITFSSGKQKNTKFIFEAKDINHKGQLRFSGHNKSLSESRDCYSLVGTLDNSKLFLESLKYDYTTQNTRVRGVVRRK